MVLALALRGRHKSRKPKKAGPVDERTRAALLDCYKQLKREGAGFGPWLSSCIVRMNAGAGVLVPVAIQALKLTADELRGRHDLGPIWRACDILEHLNSTEL